jgi:hypothetical protein
MSIINGGHLAGTPSRRQSGTTGRIRFRRNSRRKAMRFNGMACMGDLFLVPVHICEMVARSRGCEDRRFRAIRAVFLDAYAIMQKRCSNYDFKIATLVRSDALSVLPNACGMGDIMRSVRSVWDSKRQKLCGNIRERCKQIRAHA